MRMKKYSKAGNNKTVGLALGSGGVRGLAHVGIIKTLIENGIPIDNIAGTSIGAWVGAHYALFQDIEKLEEYTVGKKKEKFLSMLEISFKGGVIKGRKIVQLFDEWLDGAAFEDTKIPIKIIAADVITGEQVVFDSGKLAPAIRASISIPSLFEPFSYKGNTLIDGGICNPVPVDIAKGMGSDVIIATSLPKFSAMASLIRLTAIAIPWPYSALSSNNEFAHAGPLPSAFFVYGVEGADPPQMDEQPVALAIIILSP